jgi:hypothetical protein
MRELSHIFSLTTSSANPMSQRKISFDTFLWLVLLLVGLGIMRSAIATRLDGFTLDEAYHIAAGVSVSAIYGNGSHRLFCPHRAWEPATETRLAGRGLASVFGCTEVRTGRRVDPAAYCRAD